MLVSSVAAAEMFLPARFLFAVLSFRAVKNVCTMTLLSHVTKGQLITAEQGAERQERRLHRRVSKLDLQERN